MHPYRPIVGFPTLYLCFERTSSSDVRIDLNMKRVFKCLLTVHRVCSWCYCSCVPMTISITVWRYNTAGVPMLTLCDVTTAGAPCYHCVTLLLQVSPSYHCVTLLLQVSPCYHCDVTMQVSSCYHCLTLLCRCLHAITVTLLYRCPHAITV